MDQAKRNKGEPLLYLNFNAYSKCELKWNKIRK